MRSTCCLMCLLYYWSILWAGKNGDLSQKFWRLPTYIISLPFLSFPSLLINSPYLTLTYSTKDPGQNPFTFKIGQGSVIKGIYVYQSTNNTYHFHSLPLAFTYIILLICIRVCILIHMCRHLISFSHFDLFSHCRMGWRCAWHANWWSCSSPGNISMLLLLVLTWKLLHTLWHYLL